MPHPLRSSWAVPLALVLFLAAGCEREGIRTYTVPKPPPEVFEPKVRLLAAVLENGEQQWFFKLVGPTEAVGKHSEAFKKFVSSVRFTGKAEPPVEWTVPAGWEKGPAKELRYATFYPAGKDRSLELTVFKFDQVSPLLANVQRWCDRDLGRRHPRESELGQYTRTFRAGDLEGTLVDMTGPGVKKAKHPPMMPPPDVRTPERLPIKYVKPEGWTETGGRTMVLNAFQIREGGRSAEVTIQQMGANFGDVLSNVNRWRGQVGLKEISQAQLDREPARSVKVDGKKAEYYDLAGPEKRMLLVIVKYRNKSWFFKMLGSTPVVGKNKDAFESFVQSVKFTGAADE
jgi:hypothetical protein